MKPSRKSQKAYAGAVKLSTLLSALFLLTACGDSPEQGEGQQMPPAQVTTQTVQAESVTYFRTVAGRVRGDREVEVRAQVSGILLERKYEEGELVEQGQQLFLIDPEPYRLALNAAEADLETAQSNNEQAQRTWQRVENLFEQGAISESDRDDALNQRNAAQARLAAAESAVNDARRNLRYTRVESPVTGIAGMETMSEGNLVNSGTDLTVVTQTDPVQVHFSLTEREAMQRRQGMRQASESDLYEQVYLVMPDGNEYAQTGTIDFVDSRVDPTTGNIRMRARFANLEGGLLPGQFIRVRVALQDYSDVFLIDESVISQGQQGEQVYVVESGKAKVRPVETGPVINGRRVILDGLQNGDELIVNGHVSVYPDADVQVTDNGEG